MRNPVKTAKRQLLRVGSCALSALMVLGSIPAAAIGDGVTATYDNFFDTELMPHMNATAPAVNVKEDATAYTMEIAAPGLKKDMVKMNIDKDGYLNVSIENKNEKKEEKKEEHYLRREFSYSSYSQSYALPEDADQEKISAEVSDGVLKIEIPKIAKEEKKDDVKHIEVK